MFIADQVVADILVFVAFPGDRDEVFSNSYTADVATALERWRKSTIPTVHDIALLNAFITFQRKIN